MRVASANFILLAGLLSLSACAGLPVRGSVGGQTIETRVDSEVARYYLASYLAGRRGDPALDERIDRVYRSVNGEIPDRAELKRLSEEFSLDFAALYLADRITGAPLNRRFWNAFDQARAYIRKALPENRVRLPAAAAKYEVVFVPGYLYARVAATGADFAVPREALKQVGLAYYFVEVDEDGAVEANADLVAAAVLDRAKTGRRLILISASKSGPEVALALSKLGAAETRHVAAWINAVGSLQGTPLADEQLLPELENLVGEVDVAGMESLTTARSRQRFDALRVPKHVLVVNYLGIPVTGSVSSLAGLGFGYLQSYGPNDGITLLSDSIFPGSVTVAELGSDHFLIGVEMDVTTVALTTTIIRWLEEQEPKRSARR